MSEEFGFDQIAPESGAFYKAETPGDRFAGIISNCRWIKNNFASDGGPEKHFAFDVTDTDGTVITVKLDKKGLRDAIKDAGIAAGVNGLKAGDYCEGEYIGDGEALNGLNPPKLFKAVYEVIGA